MKYDLSVNFNKKFKENKVNFKNNKAIMALDALIGTILSVIALLILLQLMYMFFFQNNDVNLKIAENNAKSIVDFVDTYSYGNSLNPYSDFESCFYVLKLQNLENYQLQKDSENTYSYIVDPEGVLIVNNKNAAKFEDNYKLDSSMIVKKIKFKNEVQLRRDDTDSGFLKFDVLFVEFGGSSSLMFKTLLNPQYLYIKQKQNIITSGYDKNNILNSFIPAARQISSKRQEEMIQYDDTNMNFFQMVEGGYLVHFSDRNNNVLFSTNSELSNIYVKNNLCSKKYIEKSFSNSYYSNENNLLNIDYFNKEIVFTCIQEDTSKSLIKLTWNGAKFVCTDESNVYCPDFMTQITAENYQSLFNNNNPKDTKLADFCKKNIFNYMYSFSVIGDSTEKFDSNNKIAFDSLFQKDDFSYNGKKLVDLNKEDKQANSFVILKEFYQSDVGGVGINNCEISKFSYCKDIYNKNGENYFYLKKASLNENQNFYSFNNNGLRKKVNEKGEIEIYFLGKEIEYSKPPLKLDRYGTSFSNADGVGKKVLALFSMGSSDDLAVYELKLKGLNIEGFESKEISVYLTPLQFGSIQELLE